MNADSKIDGAMASLYIKEWTGVNMVVSMLYQT